MPVRMSIEEKNGSLAERFTARVGSPNANGCRTWMALRDEKGYGVIGYGRGRWRRSHRIAWELAAGPIPTGMHVLHRCDNPPCCAVEHLFLGTNKDNVADKMSKGRQSRGRPSPNGKLTATDVACARTLYRAGASGLSLSKVFSVRVNAMWNLLNGRTYQWVPA
jgi:hypothetical protein